MHRTLPGLALLFVTLFTQAQEAPIVQPGAPGEPSRQLSADEAISQRFRDELAVTV